MIEEGHCRSQIEHLAHLGLKRVQGFVIILVFLLMSSECCLEIMCLHKKFGFALSNKHILDNNSIPELFENLKTHIQVKIKTCKPYASYSAWLI